MKKLKSKTISTFPTSFRHRWKVKYLTVMLLVFGAFLATAQTNSDSHETCGFDHNHKTLLESDPGYAKRIKANEKQIQQIINQESAKAEGDIYTIPVVVHVIHLGEALGTGTNISTEQIETAIAALNDDFRKLGNGNGDGVDTKIEFCMAQQTPDGEPSIGITRIDGTGTCQNGFCYESAGITIGSGSNQVAVKALNNWPNTDYYNIWIVSEINNNEGLNGVQGFATPPGAGNDVDGSVVLYNSFGANDDGSCSTCNLKPYAQKNRVATHEIGHGLNLLHTFEGDRDLNGNSICPPYSNTTSNGDQVTDTPPHKRSSNDCNTGGMNACYDDEPTDDFIHNYMDYSDEDCQNMFSAGQSARMRATLEGPRSSLLVSEGCNSPCPGFTANFTASSQSIPVGDVITFESVNPNAVSFSWTIESSNYTTSTVTHEFNQEGVFDICLEASNGSCTDLECISVTVNGPGPCEVAPDEIENGGFNLPGYTITQDCQEYSDDVPAWYVSHGTPDLQIEGGDFITRMWASNDIESSTKGEGIFNCYNFEAYKEYQICFRYRGAKTPFPTDDTELLVWAATGLTEGCLGNVDHNLEDASPDTQEAIGSFEFDFSSGGIQTPWVNAYANFTPTQNFNQLWIHPQAFLLDSYINAYVDDIQVVEIDPAAYTVSPDVALCPEQNPSTQLVASGGDTYNWIPTNGLSCTSCANPVASPGTTTTYTVEITKGGNCGPVKREVTVTVDCDAVCIPIPKIDYEISDCDVTFVGRSDGDEGTYKWDFGDGSIATGQNQNHTYLNSGTYQVCLTIECDDLSSATYCVEVTVECPIICIPVPSIDMEINGCEVAFFGRNNGDEGSYEWDFGDGTTAIGQNQNYTYLNSGTYTVCLTIVCDDLSSVAYCQEITVECIIPCEIGPATAELVFAGCNGTNTLFNVIFPDFPVVDINDISLTTTCCNGYSNEIFYYDNQNRLHYNGIRTSGITDLCFTISLGEDCSQSYCFELPNCITKSETGCGNNSLIYVINDCNSDGNSFGITASPVFYDGSSGPADEIHVYNVENPTEEEYNNFSPYIPGQDQYTTIQFQGTDINGDGLVTIHIEILSEEGLVCDDYKTFNPEFICDDADLLDFIFTGGPPPGSSNEGRDERGQFDIGDQLVNLSAIDKLSIYPVPASQFINISNPEQFKVSIEVLNVDGKLMSKSALSQDHLLTVQSGEFPSGVYLIRIKDEQHNVLLNQLVPVSH